MEAIHYEKRLGREVGRRDKTHKRVLALTSREYLAGYLELGW
jgi:hypothetical protein